MTTSTPPAWNFLHECSVPVETPETLVSATLGKQTGGEALSTDPRILPDTATLHAQNDSPDPTYQDCLPGEEYRSYGPFHDGDQCPERRCAPGQPHAPGCDEAAKVTDSVSHAVETHAAGNCLLDSMERTFNSCMDIAAAKNHDYAADVDPFLNFRECGRFGVGIDSGILVRMSDKWSRLCQLAKPGKTAAVSDETLVDTVLDLINYAAILVAVYEDEA